MPSNLLNADIGFPAAKGKPEQSIKEVLNYLYMLLEQLRYSFANLDRDNFNDKGFRDIAAEINKPVLIKLEDTEKELKTELTVKAGELSSRISDNKGNLSKLIQKVDSFRLSVENGYSSSTLTLTANGIALSSQEIEFQGVATFYSLSTPGKTVIDGGNIRTGTIEAIDISGCRFYVNMDASNQTTGDILFRYNGDVAGRIAMDNSGAGTGYESEHRIFMQTYHGFALKLEADNGFSATSDRGIFMRCFEDMVLEARDNIYLKTSGEIYIGDTKTLKEYIEEIIEEKS